MEDVSHTCHSHFLSFSPSLAYCYSMGGHRVVPSADEHFYCATKFAVTALTEGLRQELREAKTHIRATVRIAALLFFLFHMNLTTVLYNY